MKVYLLVEGNSDQAFFQTLLPSDIRQDTIVVPVGGRSNITSIARSLLVTKRRPLALVTDADTIEKDAIERRYQMLDELIGSATAGVPYKVILAVPEIESWYFKVPNVLERLSGKQLSSEQRELGELRPKEVLSRLFEGRLRWSLDKLAGELTDSEVKTLRETYPRRELIEFLTEQVEMKTEPQPV